MPQALGGGGGMAQYKIMIILLLEVTFELC